MRQSSSRPIISCVLVSIVAVNSSFLIIAQEPSDEDRALTGVEFVQLNPKEQFAYLRDSIARFRDRTQNISATITSSSSSDYHDRFQISENVFPPPESVDRFDFRRIGTSYWIAQHQSQVDAAVSRKREASIEKYEATTDDLLTLAYDITPRFPVQQIIHTSHGPGKIIQVCFFARYMGGVDGSSDRIPADLMERFLHAGNRGTVTSVDQKDGIVHVEFRSETPSGRPETNTATFDLSKQGLITRMQITRWSSYNGVRVAVKKYDFQMHDFEEIDGVLIPTKISVSDALGAFVTVHIERIKNIKLNTLSPDDLKLPVPM